MKQTHSEMEEDRGRDGQKVNYKCDPDQRRKTEVSYTKDKGRNG